MEYCSQLQREYARDRKSDEAGVARRLEDQAKREREAAMAKAQTEAQRRKELVR